MTAPDDPRAARLEELIASWRERAIRHEKHGDCYRVGESWGLTGCADDLERALAAALSGSSGAPHSTYKQWMGLSENIIVVPETTTKKEIMREGESSVEATSSRTAATSESQSHEICICAAVQTEERLVIRGHRHHDALRAATLAFCHPLKTEDGQGFVTSTGRYVTREEGYRLQVAANIGSRDPGGYRGERLFSEDLY